MGDEKVGDNRAAKAARQKKWASSHPRTEEQKRVRAERQRQWRADNPELAKQQAKDRYDRDPESAYLKQKAWRERNPERWAEIQRRNYLKRKYGISLEDYNNLVLQQDGKCGVCGTSDPGGPKTVSCLAVDHDHATGEIRGLLCAPCNRGLGIFKDDPSLLQAAIAYITR